MKPPIFITADIEWRARIAVQHWGPRLPKWLVAHRKCMTRRGYRRLLGRLRRDGVL